jgi:hypothetical protein
LQILKKNGQKKANHPKDSLQRAVPSSTSSAKRFVALYTHESPMQKHSEILMETTLVAFVFLK